MVEKRASGNVGQSRAAVLMWLLIAAVAMLDVGALLAPRLGPVSAVIDASAMSPEAGLSFAANLPRLTRFPLWIADDRDGANNRSQLQLLENDRALGPAHASHASIADEGAGRFSHWNGGLRFSTSDGSDPRVAAREYRVRAPRSVHPTAWMLLAGANGAVLASLLLWAAPRRRALREAAQRHATRMLARAAPVARMTWFAWVVLIGVVCWLVIAADESMTARSQELVVPALAAALGGALIASLQILTGAGALRLLIGEKRASGALACMLGYPIGLVLLALLVAIALVWLPASPLGAAFVIVLMLMLSAFAPRETQLLIVRVSVRALPAALLIGLAMGVVWHPPTESFSAIPMGDLVYYGAKSWMLEASPWPHHNLCLEGESWAYFNALPSAMAALAIRSGCIEPQMLIAGAAPAFALTALAVLLHAARKGEVAGSIVAVLALAALIACATRYASWVIESPPVAQCMPMLVVAGWLVVCTTGRFWSGTGAGIVITVGAILSKVTTLPALAVLVAASMLRSLWRRPTPGAIVVTVVCALLFGAFSWRMLSKFGAIFSAASGIGPESLSILSAEPEAIAWAWPFVVRDAGMVLLPIIGLCIAPEAAVVGAVAAALFLIKPFLFNNGAMVTLLVVAGMALSSHDGVRRLPRVLPWIIPLLLWTALHDTDGWATRVAWIASALMIAMVALDRDGALRRHGVGVASVLLLAAATAAGWIDPAHDNSKLQHGVLTPSVREAWIDVRRVVPHDALVFTDMAAGPNDTSLTGGWNTYAASGQRQLYFTNWFQSERLRADMELAIDVERVNAEALASHRDPRTIATSRAYGSFWAVVSNERSMAPSWTLEHRGSAFSLYRWTAP